MWKVRSVSETYEPGSVFKLITAAVALEENITRTDVANDFYCNGFEDISGTIIQCWKYQAPYYSSHGPESLRDALMNSCNPSFMQLAKRIGVSRGCISAIEIGRNKLYDKLLEKIYSTFNIDPDSFQNGNELLFLNNSPIENCLMTDYHLTKQTAERLS